MSTSRNLLAAAAFIGAVAASQSGALANTQATVAGHSQQAATQAALKNTAMLHETLFFDDRFASAYYAFDPATSEVKITIRPGLEGQGNPMQFVTKLEDGARADFSIDGYGQNKLMIKLSLKRDGQTIIANIETEERDTTS